MDSLRFAYRRYRLKFRQPVRTARTLWTVREGLLVRLESAEGRVGWGEAAPVPAFGMESMDVLETAARNWPHFDPKAAPTLANALANARQELHGGQVISEPDRGQVNSDGERLERSEGGQVDSGSEGGQAESAPPKGARLERGQVISGSSAAEGGQVDSVLPVAALLPAGSGVVAVAKERAEAGFRTFKWKVGVGDWRDELGLLDDLCAELPGGSRLRLDANGAWDRRVAGRWLERCADRPVEFVEQPVDWAGAEAEDLLMGLAGDYPTAIALDESMVGGGDIERWLGNGWPGVYVIKPSLLAEPTATVDRLRTAKAKVVFSSALETGLGARAALAQAFAWRGLPMAIGFGVWPIFDDGRFDGPAAAPFIRRRDLERIDVERIWNALS